MHVQSRTWLSGRGVGQAGRAEQAVLGTCWGGTEAREQHAPVAACFAAPSSQQLLLCPARHLWNDRRSSGAPAKRFLAPSRGRPKNGFPPKNGARVFALAFERCSKPCFGPSEGVGGALAPAGGPHVRGCQPLSAAPGVTPGAPSPAAAPKKGTRMHVRTRAASLQLYSTARVYWENSAPHRLPVSTSGSCLVNGSESAAACGSPF